ncbi:hypothetical protein MTR_4g113260 [Medicago truncatula]|uniref:Uncharacterized protein n=1 Tax=Medicago truncatula TaxID=3880 RepID=G7JU75_MEDTR|nr:hypothetical protein MTR_4g113260 [Medicago truncatula]
MGSEGNTLLLDALNCRISVVSDIPHYITFGADLSRPESGEDTCPSVVVVVVVVVVVRWVSEGQYSTRFGNMMSLTPFIRYLDIISPNRYISLVA